MGSKPSVNFTKENQNHESLFLACNVAQEKQEYIWFLDSRCSTHMTGNLAMFSNLDESVKSEVTFTRKFGGNYDGQFVAILTHSRRKSNSSRADKTWFVMPLQF